MRIGFDISQTGWTKAGCGWFADSLIRHLAEIDRDNQYILYPTFGDFVFDRWWRFGTCRIRQPNVRRGLGHWWSRGADAFWRNPPADMEERLGRPDIIHANNFFCPTQLTRARLVYTLYDLSFVERPEWSPEDIRSACFTGVSNASTHADRILAISAYTKRHFLDVFPHYPPEHVVVAHPGSRFPVPKGARRPARLAAVQPGRFWLNVGTLEPRKNHARLLRAYARLRAAHAPAMPLVLAGGTGWLLADLDRTITSLGLQQDVMLAGYVDDEALQWLYENCFAFVYPALFEGFGLPVLEAMSLGAPVIASQTASIPEIVGSAGVLVDPLDEEALLAAMQRLAAGEVERATLRDRGRERAKAFSWQHTARTVLDLYEEVMRPPNR